MAKEVVTRFKQPKKPTRKSAKQQKGWDTATKAVMKRSGGMCEIRIPGVCSGRGTGTHHRLRRSQGGQAETDFDIALLARICVPCDVFIEANPAYAYEHGHLLHRWDVHPPAD